MEIPIKEVLLACRTLRHCCSGLQVNRSLTQGRLYHAVKKTTSFSGVYRAVPCCSTPVRGGFLNKIQFLHGSDRKFGHLQPIIWRPPLRKGQLRVVSGSTADQQSTQSSNAGAGTGTTEGGGPGSSRIWQNFHAACEAGLNRQINMELYAGYVYISMASYFRRDDVSLPGLAEFFHKSSIEEREHAEKLMDYLNRRGGRVILSPIEKPGSNEWGSIVDALKVALELEKTVNQSLLDLHKCAGEHGDAQMCDFLETHFLEEQVVAIKKLGDYITQAERVGKGLGEWEFDKFMKEESQPKE